MVIVVVATVRVNARKATKQISNQWAEESEGYASMWKRVVDNKIDGLNIYWQ